MQVIINIPERIYKRQGYLNNIDSAILRNALKDGKPLPKGHGRLIDESEVTQIFCHKEESFYKNLKYERVIIDYTDAPTILEADKEEE